MKRLYRGHKKEKPTLDQIKNEQKWAEKYFSNLIKNIGGPYELKRVYYTGKKYSVHVKYTGRFPTTFFETGETVLEVAGKIRKRVFR